MKVRELMTETPRTCGQGDSAADAAEVMWAHDVGVVPVVDARGTLIGVVTDRDVCMAALHAGLPLVRIPVTTAMSRDVHACRADDSVPAALERMADARVRRLPVLDDGDRLVGMLSINDVERHVVDSGSPSLARALVATLGAIGRKRLSLPPLKSL